MSREFGAYDAVVIGSGHNALVASAYLSRAGWRVLVLERNDRPGGLLRTEELTLPGFKHDVYSAAHPLFLTGPAYADLRYDLATHGLKY
ncbi:MAG TPA: NAD(P)-binding protein, partial [Gemmatimonadaceae bacterium]